MKPVRARFNAGRYPVVDLVPLRKLLPSLIQIGSRLARFFSDGDAVREWAKAGKSGRRDCTGGRRTPSFPSRIPPCPTSRSAVRGEMLTSPVCRAPHAPRIQQHSVIFDGTGVADQAIKRAKCLRAQMLQAPKRPQTTAIGRAHEKSRIGFPWVVWCVSEEEWRLRCELAPVHRLIAHFVFADMTYNRISVRVPGERGHFLVKADNVFMEQATTLNLVKYDIDGKREPQQPRPTRPKRWEIGRCSVIHGQCAPTFRLNSGAEGAGRCDGPDARYAGRRAPQARMGT